MTGFDYAIVIIFLCIIAGAGATISRLIRSPDDLFVAGRQLTPFVLAATITATNLSMFHFVGMGGTASQDGVSIIWQNWTGDIALVLSGLFVLPFMRRLRIRSIPEFLEIRYTRGLRTLVGAFWSMRLCVYLGILLYIAGSAAAEITHWNHYIAWLFVFSAVSILYSTVGGAWAVAIMDSVQFLTMLAGALIMFPIAMHAAGGLPSMIHYFKSTPGRFHFIDFVPTRGTYNWMFIVAIMLLSLKWSTIDQSILQRAFGAHNPRVGAKGMVLSGLITTPMAFLWILPGIAVARLHPQGFANPDEAIPWLLRTQLPAVATGLLGFVLCGLVAAQISVITADVNSVATLMASDVYRTLRGTEPGQRELMRVVRINSLVCGAVMIATAILLKMTNAGAVKANLVLVGILDMPLFIVTVIYGIAFKRTNWQGAVAGFVVGGIAGIGCYLLIDPQLFHTFIYSPISRLSVMASTWLTGLNHQLLPRQGQLRNLAPIISSGTALVVTPLVSLLFAKPPASSLRVRQPADRTDSGEIDDFTLIPHSLIGKLAAFVVVVSAIVFILSVISAAWSWPLASPVALSAMVAALLAGVVRVYVK